MVVCSTYAAFVVCLIFSLPSYSNSANPVPVSSKTTNSCMLDAARRTLVSPKADDNSDAFVKVRVRNYLPVPLIAYVVDDKGTWYRLTRYTGDAAGNKHARYYTPIAPYFLSEGSNASDPYIQEYFNVPMENFYIIFSDLIMGGLVSVIAIGDEEHFPDSSCLTKVKGTNAYVNIDPSQLGVPNAIGSPPIMNKISPIPSDSMPILIGVTYLGKFAVNDNGDSQKKNKEKGRDFSYIKADRVITRHQYWAQAGMSLVVAPGEYVQYTTETTYGTEEESSSAQSFSASLGMSASAGYGPISASVSASLTASSSYSHSISIQTSETSTYQKTVDNHKGTEPLILQYFQLTDVLTAAGWDGHNNIMASSAVLIQKNTPALLATNDDVVKSSKAKK